MGARSSAMVNYRNCNEIGLTKHSVVKKSSHSSDGRGTLEEALCSSTSSVNFHRHERAVRWANRPRPVSAGACRPTSLRSSRLDGYRKPWENVKFPRDEMSPSIKHRGEPSTARRVQPLLLLR